MQLASCASVISSFVDDVAPAMERICSRKDSCLSIRFDCGLERLENVSLEALGQGRLYVRSHSGAPRRVPAGAAARWLSEWRGYRERIVAAASGANRPFLLDCHSFPADLAPDVAVCQGSNEGAPRPARDVFTSARAAVEAHGFRVAFNTPYGNSILPAGWEGLRCSSNSTRRSTSTN